MRSESEKSFFIPFILLSIFFSIINVSAVSLNNLVDDEIYLQTSVTGYNFSITGNSTADSINLTNSSIFFDGTIFLKIKNVDDSIGYLNFINTSPNKLIKNALTNSIIYDFSSGGDYNLTLAPSLEVELVTKNSNSLDEDEKEEKVRVISPIINIYNFIENRYYVLFLKVGFSIISISILVLKIFPKFKNKKNNGKGSYKNNFLIDQST